MTGVDHITAAVVVLSHKLAQCLQQMDPMSADIQPIRASMKRTLTEKLTVLFFYFLRWKKKPLSPHSVNLIEISLCRRAESDKMIHLMNHF